jgi:hypothetical protein
MNFNQILSLSMGDGTFVNNLWNSTPHIQSSTPQLIRAHPASTPKNTNPSARMLGAGRPSAFM